MKKNILSLTLFTLCMLAMQSCIWIDDDLAACGKEAQITYEVKLITTLDLELNTVLNVDTDMHVRATFTKFFENIFVDYVHDVDLSFYSLLTQERVYHEMHIIDASQKSFVLFLKSDQYTHLSACNIADAVNVALIDDADPATMQLKQQVADTLDTQTTGLFTARLTMDVASDSSQNFIVPLYMANSGIGLLVDTLGSGVKDMRVYVRDMATNFFVQDSLFLFNGNPYMRMKQLELVEFKSDMPLMKAPTSRSEHRLCFAAACFPSHDTMVDEEYTWRVYVYVTTAEGKITENILKVKTPLRASSLRILKVRFNPDGQAIVEAEDVGASVDLDWHGGNVFNPEL